jgi:trk/ktr system potassium uptake protein
MTKYPLLVKLEKYSGYLLNLLALFNFQILILSIVEFERGFHFQYTQYSIYFLIFYKVLSLVNDADIKFYLWKSIPDIIFITIGLTVYQSERVFAFYLLGRQTFIAIRNLTLSGSKGSLLDRLSDNPPVFVLFSFFLAIFVGTLFLLLPSATVKGEVTTLIGALFTSTSATCVTGLIVYDTGTHFTLFGQTIILFLIQVGGLGIMTVSSAFAIMLGQRLSIKRESLIQNVVGEANKIDMVNLLKNVFFVTISFEIIGAALMYLTFRHDFTSNNYAIYCSVFHSISAFCNAGFSLFRNSMINYSMNFNINFVITSLIILGGIGFPVLVDIRRTIVKRLSPVRLTLHTKMVLAGTIGLLLIGFIGFFIAEYNSTMKDQSLIFRIFTSFFQSVTTRTAGFNTIDNGALNKASVLLSSILMFIGASPGSTAGGIKTTALIVVFVSVTALFRGSKDVNIFKRKISEDIIYRVLALIAASIALLAIMIFLLLMLEPFRFEKILFEAISAFGTVGLSMGVTAQLTDLSKVIIIFLMYLGRVGPLTLIFAISEKKIVANYSYTEERISIG